MPVSSVNGASAASMSSFGCGPLGMIHSFTVVPGLISDFAAWSVLPVPVLPSSSSPPQPEYTRAPANSAAIASATTANLLLTILSSLVQKRFWYCAWDYAREPLRRVTP